MDRPIRNHIFRLSTLVILGWLMPLPAAAGPEDQTADLPDSWLVLYNLDNADSVAWAAWYQQERGIPAGNMVGLNASLDEHLPTLASVQSQVISPVRTLLDGSAELRGRIMGIILGYGLPGHYAVPPGNGPGGYSVADALMDMYDDALPPSEQKGTNWDCPKMYDLWLPANGRLTRATMLANQYMVARIDAPSLAEAMLLTQRAKQMEDPSTYVFGQYVWYDYTDPSFGTSGQWYWLRVSVQDPVFAEVPWMPFDADTQQTPNDAMRFGGHDVDGWNDGRLNGLPAGARIIAYDYDSWGATTVRSTTADGARFVPNALAAGYAAAIGPTGEPLCCLGPIPGVLIASLREGWTLGESFYLCTVWQDWMWTLVGDPFLTMPHWFDDEPPLPGACCHPDGACTQQPDEATCTASGGTFQGSGTDCAATNCPVLPGACCWPDGVCWDVPDEAFCTSVGGAFQGYGTDCQTANCPLVAGACCWPDGVCWDGIGEAGCGATGGVFQGIGTDCLMTNCPILPGACCRADGSCTDEPDEAACIAVGGVFQGNGTICVTADCPVLPGACCRADGSCTDEPDEAACIANGGIFQGNGTICVTADCPVLPGACCRGDSRCTDEPDEATCVALGGVFQGNGTICGATDCSVVFGACCYPEGLCTEESDPAACAASGGTYEGFGSQCAIVYCPVQPGACCRPDGTCTQESDAPACVAVGGGFHGCGSECGTSNCPILPGACCHADYSCTDEPDTAACDVLGGTFRGHGSECAALNCDPNYVLPGDMNNDGVVDGMDIQLLTSVLAGAETDPDLMQRADVYDDDVLNDNDLFLFFGPSLYETHDPSVLRGSGDTNADGLVDGDDIGGFVQALTCGFQGDELLRIQFAPDMNQDGQTDMADLPLFVERLVHSQQAAAPPASSSY